MNIAKSQEKQVNTKNHQTSVSHDNLMKGDTVYLKNCKVFKNKFEDEDLAMKFNLKMTAFFFKNNGI